MPLQLLNADQSRRFDRHLTAVCQAYLAEVDSPLLAERLLTYARQGGKRIRPQLVLWTYQHCQRSDEAAEPGHLPVAVMDVAAAWELFHAFLLVHDDIIDGSDSRRGRPSLHRQLQSLDSDSPRFGVNLGIVAGDLFYAWANRLLADLDLPGDAYRDLHRLFARVAMLTGLGQAVDVLQSHAPIARRDEATLLREYHWKTAAYTFEGPMLSAAVLAGLPPDAHAAISGFSLALGQAYQLQNDLLDVVRPVTEGSDLAEGKHTLTLLKARQFLDDAARDTFDRDVARIVQGEGRAIALAESVRQRLLATPAVGETSDRIAELLDSSLAHAATLPPRLAGAMAACVAGLRATYFRAGIPVA